jgi:hypothetical protein
VKRIPKKILLWNPISDHGHLNMYLDLYITELKKQKYEIFCLMGMEEKTKKEFLCNHPKIKFVEDLQFTENLKFTKDPLKRYTPQWITLVFKNLSKRYFDLLLVRLLGILRFLAISVKLQRGVNFDFLVRNLLFLKKHNLSFDLVICMYLDYTFLTARTSRRLDNLGTPWVGLYFHPPKSNTANLVARSNFQLSKSNKGFIFFSQSNMENFKSKVRKDQICMVLPDITQTEASQSSDNYPDLKVLSAGRTIVGMIGAVDGEKKMPELFIKVSKELDMSGYFFVLIGEFYWNSLKNLSNFKNEIKSGYLQNNLFILDEYIKNDKEYNYLFSSCDLIFACYRNFEGSANTLSKSSFFHKPIIVNTESSLAATVEKYNLGVSISPINVETIKQAIKELSEKNATNSDTFDFEGYSMMTSPAAFSKLLERYLALVLKN